MDQEIANTITGENGLESEIVESPAIQEAISDKISQVKRTLNILTTPTTPTTLNVSAAEFVPPQHPTMPATQPITHPATTRPSVSRLPKLSLPIFSGDPFVWQSFWNSLEAAVNSSSTLDGVQKSSIIFEPRYREKHLVQLLDSL